MEVQTLLALILGLGNLIILFFVLLRLGSIDSEVHGTNILLTVIANKQGATQEDVDAALKK